MNHLKNYIKNLQWKFWMYRGMHSIKQSDIHAKKIRQAIRETISHAISPEEKDRIAPIEQIREQFTGNPAEVAVVDYGAGDPDLKRSDDDMTRGIHSVTTYDEICKGSKPALWALLLFKIIRNIQPELVLEMGTCIGITAAYQATALQLNGKGRLITIEGSETVAALAKENIKSLNLNNVDIKCGAFKEVLPVVFEKISTVDYVFIDGHHDEQATIAYFDLLLPYLSSGAIVVFDDISWSKGMRRAWEQVRKHPAVSFSVDLKILGICIL